jgi:hypothetical protein
MLHHRHNGKTSPILLLVRNVVSPYFSDKEDEPQGTLMEMRVKENGESERQSVMD